jgi:mono/diheme cytochrome c family protein
LLVVLLAAAASGCTLPGSKNLDTETEPVDLDAGRTLFQTTCRACHSLADAHAAGVFGPDLDLLQPDATRVRQQIDRGGGGMPADLLTGADADLVARYVAKVAGAGDESGDGTSTTRGNTKAKPDA